MVVAGNGSRRFSAMPHCDVDANRPMDEAGCRGEVAQQFFFCFASTLECKQALLAAIGALVGSCCDQLGMGADASQLCRIAMKTLIVPWMKQVVAEKWPSNFTLTLSPTAPVDMKFAIQKRVLSVELIMECVRAKIMAARGSCHGPTCPRVRNTALLVAIGTLDGSCCDQLGMGAVAGQQCCTAMKLQLVPQL